MSRHIEATFEIASCDETPFEDGNEATKLTEALVTKRYDGDIKGTSTTKWLVSYAPDKSALSGTDGVDNAAGTGRFQADPAGSLTRHVDGLDTATAGVRAGSHR